MQGKFPLLLKIKVQLVMLKKYFLIRKKGHFQGSQNKEGKSEWNISQSAFSSKARKKGISGFARLKNSEIYLEKVIEAHLPYLDEIILVDNNSKDSTWKICQRLQNQYPNKIKIFQYLPEVYKLGSEAYRCWSADSLHDMSYYYNWTLAQTSYQYAIKIDDDHLPLPEVFTQLRKEILAGKYEKTFLALGLYNIEKGESGLELNLAHPLAGLYGDFGVFPVSEKTYFIRDKMCENFIHNLKRKRGGIWLFHLKFRKEGFGYRNYVGTIKSWLPDQKKEKIPLSQKLYEIFMTFNIK